MATMSLSKALKVKARLGGRMSKLQLDIMEYNSTLEGMRDEVDVAALDLQRSKVVEALIGLKTAINKASVDIMQTIYTITERKAEIEHLRSLSTKHGIEPAHGLATQPSKYVAIIQKKDVNDRIKRLESEIDTLQDEIDNYNSAKNRVDVQESWIELAS